MDRCSRRETSSADLMTYLYKKGYAKDIARAVCEEMVASNFINDERYAGLWVRAQALRGKGALWIRSKLNEKGIQLSVQQIKALLQEATNVSEEDTARRLIERKYPGAANDPKIALRASQMLLRNGYSFDIVRRINARPNPKSFE